METSTKIARRDADARLAAVAERLAASRCSSLADLGEADVAQLAALGLRVDGNAVRLDDDIDLLRERAIRAGLDERATRWLRALEVRASIDSTNAYLLAEAAKASVGGRVATAEMQTAGRGRRGRRWLSPFGRNLAVSVGLSSARPSAEVGALSLAVGLAVRAALLEQGLVGVELKWPNDVLLHGRKVAGILIELARPTPPVEIVVGIGVNVGCAEVVRARVDQAVADVAEQLSRPSRNALLAAILNQLVAYAGRFEAEGFAPLRQAWQDAHRYQRAEVAVRLPAGGPVTGTVLGIREDGALLLETDSGQRAFSGGEITVRPAAP